MSKPNLALVGGALATIATGVVPGSGTVAEVHTVDCCVDPGLPTAYLLRMFHHRQPLPVLVTDHCVPDDTVFTIFVTLCYCVQGVTEVDCGLSPRFMIGGCGNDLPLGFPGILLDLDTTERLMPT